MSDFRYAQSTSTARTAQLDQGLRSYMLGVYNYMTTGLAVTGLAAIGTNMMAVTTSETGQRALTSFGAAIYRGPLHWVIALAPLGLIFAMGAARSVNSLRVMFYALSVLIGVSLSVVLLAYSGGSIARVFFITAASFGALSLYGYTTKKSLSGMGTFLMMGLFGLIIAMIVNIFMASSAMQFVISVIGVLLFAGFTAYDTQAIKSGYLEAESYGASSDHHEYNAIHGAVQLYLDFVNLFQFLLSLFGDRR